MGTAVVDSPDPASVRYNSVSIRLELTPVQPDAQLKRVKLSDVARRAGVGPATVDRVLNERGNVSEDIAKRVISAARELGLKRYIPEEGHRRLLRIDVILARPELPLIERMNLEFRQLATSLDRSIVIHRTVLEDEKPETLARALRKTSCDAVISYMQDHPSVHSVVSELHSKGIPVVTVISDVPGSTRLGYAGIDHYKAGRTSAYFVNAVEKDAGPVIILCNHRGFQSHADRIRGFQDYLRSAGSPLVVTDVLEGFDDNAHSEMLLCEAFACRRAVAAVYNVGAANDAVVRAIDVGILSRRPTFIGHELTRQTVGYLRGGKMHLVVDQSPEIQVRRAVAMIRRHFARADGRDDTFGANMEVPAILYGPENIPDPLPFVRGTD